MLSLSRISLLFTALAGTLAAPLVGADAQRSTVARTVSLDTVQLSIQEAVTRAVRQSDEARLASAQIELTEAQITTARATGLPQLRLNGQYTQVIENARAAIVGSVFGQSFTYNTNLNLSQTLFQGGRVFAGTRAAADARRAARFDQAEVRARLAVDVQRAYLVALLSDRLYEIQVRNLALADERLKQVERLQTAGRASRYELLRARVERTNQEPGLIQARSDRELALLEIKRLLNYPVEQPLALTSSLDVEALQEFIVRFEQDSTPDPVRPAVRSAESVLDARRHGVRVARADLLPTISAFFQTGYLALPSSNGLPTVWGQTSSSICPPGSPATRVCQNNGWFPDRSFGVQMQWPLFDGLRAKGNIDLAQAQERVAELQLAQDREQVEVERARARAEFARARASYDAQRDNAREAEEAYRLASLRFERGLDTQLEASAVQLQLLVAQTNEARSVYDLYIAAAELARARGLEIPLPPTRPAPADNSR